MILSDTGYWLALANKKDRWHQRALDVTLQLNEDLITTWPVITETCHLLLNRLSNHAQLLFLQQIQQNVRVFEIQQQHVPELQNLMEKYSDLPMDLADASLVIAANYLNQGRILSTDQRDFQSYRWKNHHPFSNILLPD